ncbi:MAG: leucyl/phenylalanyl-tRNA--protein transferase [Rickettsiales bacterium]|jgi:leucyl/phenylalanyl-tRNA--protein transferase|nr:leucyl/phenylalanyl-tRNA--protein transferase [Rickettsiales bacterium]
MQRLTPALLLAAYSQGYFPMAESRHGEEICWYEPELRGVLPLDGFHVPKSLAKFLKHASFHYSMNHAFRAVITACAERESTWINDEIIELYCQLHEMGYAQSVEVWMPDPQARSQKLVGGLYGVCLGRAFFGESMFSRTSNASKAALVYLLGHLRENGYTLLDAQYVNDHLKQFGIIEISRDEYLKRLREALS